MSEVLKLVERLESMQDASEAEADIAGGSDEHLAAVAEANAYGDAARLVREAHAKDAAELERLRAIEKAARAHWNGTADRSELGRVLAGEK